MYDTRLQREKVREEEKTYTLTKAEVRGDNNSSDEANMETFLYDLFDESDDVLANFPMPVSEKSEVESICTNSVFNNCIINCVVNSIGFWPKG